MRVVLMGPQGSGKGTQGTNLSGHWGVPHIATGDMLRQAMLEDSPRAEEIRRINAGNHVSDALVGELLYARLAEPDVKINGFILDGYPRNLAQAAILEEWLSSQNQSLNKVIALLVPRDILFERLLRRAEREGRVDDANREAIERRLSLYDAWTLPVLAFYEERGLLVRLDATGSPEQVTQNILLALSKK
jgi:adenylate kinase